MGIYCNSGQNNFAFYDRISIPSNGNCDDWIFGSSKNAKGSPGFKKVSVVTTIHYWSYYLRALAVLLSIHQGI
jgi:hypothetical protein